MSNPDGDEKGKSSLKVKYADVDDDSRHYNSKFGYGSCQPDSIQCCNTPKWLTVHVGTFVFLAGMQVTGLKAAAARPLEKQFGFTSTEIGIIAAMYDVAAAIFGFIFSFFATHGHKGKWVANGSLMMAIGSLIIAVPHFIFGAYQYSAISNTTNICNETVSPGCDGGTTNSMSSMYLFIFCLGQFVSGCGSTIIWTIAYPYLDENVSPTASPIYIGVFGALASIGPGIGYLLGGAFLNFYVDWPIRPTDITSSDPQWVGAWWIGYVLVAILMVIITIPLFAYPRHLPFYQKNKEKRAKIAIGKSVVDNNYGGNIRDLPKAVKELLTNKVFLFVTLGATTEGMTVGGLSTFVPKYLQTQLNISSSRASLISGILVVIGAASGMQLGGVIIRVKRLRPVQIARFCYSVGIAGIFCALLLLFNCQDVPIAGVTKSYIASNHNGTLIKNLAATCNNNCSCHIANYDPICGIDGTSYASPCYAGCGYSRNNATNKYYYSCSCVDKSNISAVASKFSYDAIRQLCPNNCKLLIPVLIGVTMNMFITYFNAVPASQVIMRCVPESQRCFALGINWLVLRLLGSVPGPIVIGSIIDQSCILWNEQCGKRTFCWKYDNFLLSVLLTVALVTLKILTATSFFLAWYFYNKQEKKASEKNGKNQPASSKETTDTYQIQLANESGEDASNASKF